MTTTNLAEFGNRELKMAAELLTAYSDGNFECPYFMNDGVQVMMNKNSGNVFLTNDDCQVLMMNGNKLQGFYSSPYEGHEGFIDELLDMWDEDWNSEDTEWLYVLAKDFGIVEELPVKLLELQNIK
jgi:hypothetical protein